MCLAKAQAQVAYKTKRGAAGQGGFVRNQCTKLSTSLMKIEEHQHSQKSNQKSLKLFSPE